MAKFNVAKWWSSTKENVKDKGQDAMNYVTGDHQAAAQKAEDKVAKTGLWWACTAGFGLVGALLFSPIIPVPVVGALVGAALGAWFGGVVDNLLVNFCGEKNKFPSKPKKRFKSDQDYGKACISNAGVSLTYAFVTGPIEQAQTAIGHTASFVPSCSKSKP